MRINTIKPFIVLVTLPKKKVNYLGTEEASITVAIEFTKKKGPPGPFCHLIRRIAELPFTGEDFYL